MKGHKAWQVRASFTYAETVFPEVVISLAKRKLSVYLLRETDDHKVFHLVDRSIGIDLLILEEDFMILKGIVLDYFSPFSLFSSEPIGSIRDRVLTLIKTRFADRGEF